MMPWLLAASLTPWEVVLKMGGIRCKKHHRRRGFVGARCSRRCWDGSGGGTNSRPASLRRQRCQAAEKHGAKSLGQTTRFLACGQRRLQGCDEGFAREPRSRAHPQLPPHHAGQAPLWGSVPRPSPCSSHPRLLAGALPVRRHRPFQAGKSGLPGSARGASAFCRGNGLLCNFVTSSLTKVVFKILVSTA